MNALRSCIYKLLTMEDGNFLAMEETRPKILLSTSDSDTVLAQSYSATCGYAATAECDPPTFPPGTAEAEVQRLVPLQLLIPDNVESLVKMGLVAQNKSQLFSGRYDAASVCALLATLDEADLRCLRDQLHAALPEQVPAAGGRPLIRRNNGSCSRLVDDCWALGSSAAQGVLTRFADSQTLRAAERAAQSEPAGPPAPTSSDLTAVRASIEALIGTQLRLEKEVSALRNHNRAQDRRLDQLTRDLELARRGTPEAGPAVVIDDCGRDAGVSSPDCSLSVPVCREAAIDTEAEQIAAGTAAHGTSVHGAVVNGIATHGSAAPQSATHEAAACGSAEPQSATHSAVVYGIATYGPAAPRPATHEVAAHGSAAPESATHEAAAHGPAAPGPASAAYETAVHGSASHDAAEYGQHGTAVGGVARHGTAGHSAVERSVAGHGRLTVTARPPLPPPGFTGVTERCVPMQQRRSAELDACSAGTDGRRDPSRNSLAQDIAASLDLRSLGMAIASAMQVQAGNSDSDSDDDAWPALGRRPVRDRTQHHSARRTDTNTGSIALGHQMPAQDSSAGAVSRPSALSADPPKHITGIGAPSGLVAMSAAGDQSPRATYVLEGISHDATDSQVRAMVSPLVQRLHDFRRLSRHAGAARGLKAYRIEVDAADDPWVMNPVNWPAGLRVRPWTVKQQQEPFLAGHTSLQPRQQRPSRSGGQGRRSASGPGPTRVWFNRNVAQ